MRRAALAALVLCFGPGAGARAQQAPSEAPPTDAATPEEAATPVAEPGTAAAPGSAVGELEPAAEGEPVADAEPAAEAAPVEPALAPAPDDAAPAEEIIDDPELTGVAPPPVSDEPMAPAAAAPVTAQVRAVLRSRIATDLQWQDAREDVWEATQLALLEAQVRRSERLRFAVGLSMRHLFAARDGATGDADAARYELDAAPTAGYADVTVADGLHLRLGYQSLLFGRFDVLGSTNVLAVDDLRSGPTTLPEGAEIAQPAARMDWDIEPWLSLRVIYVPFFSPHRVAVTEGDYALLRVRQGAVDAAYMDLADVLPSGGPSADELARRSRENLTRAGGARLSEGVFRAFAPDPSLAHPQGGVRLLAHGPDGELGASVVTAREHLPALRFSQAFAEAFEDPDNANPIALLADPRPFEVRYDRLAVFAVDGASAVGPVGVGVELAYVLDRTLFAAREGALPQPEQADLAQASLRLEHVSGSTWLVGLESLFAYALDQPADATREFMFLDRGRYLYGVAGMVAFGVGDGALTLELAGGLYSGPSYLVMPRVEVRLVEGLFAEAGAYVVEGEAPGAFGSPRVSLGGLYDDVDQVFLGLKWLP